jgi:single-strand selective monofunctional uracil DNA glycosylase
VFWRDKKYGASAVKTSAASNIPQLIAAARELSTQAGRLKFGPPVTHVYNPLDYARESHELFLQKFGHGRKRVIFLGMNPGPFGMAQTGVPFGEIAAVRDWLGISATVKRPVPEHPKRPVLGFNCPRSEVSGRRLWKLFSERFGRPETFFKDHFVVNFCPLAFLSQSGSNVTPDKISKVERARLEKICDVHLRRVIAILQPEWIVGVGAFARQRGEIAAEGTSLRVGQILHPSPASPKANRQDWGKTATEELVALGVWK